ncbi:MAG: acyltransferase [Bacteroidaceae bacterium]|nr:acyltransferase [Bacteroidaceae bacterium]
METETMETEPNIPTDPTESKPVTSSKKIEWLDAMRGFTMILVVAYHVAQISFGENEKTSTSLPFLVLFRMPLFFFVSGFLAYRAQFQWTVPAALRLTWKKIKVQVIPTLVFLCVFLTLWRTDFWAAFLRALQSPTKGGYWFTWVLLQMFLIYYVLCLAARGRHWIIWVAWALSIGGYETTYLPRVFSYYKDDFYAFSSLIQTMRFLQFFLLGNLVRRHWARVQQLFDSPWFFPAVCTLAFVCCAEFFRWHSLRAAWVNLPRTLAMYSLLLLVVMFFRHYASWFTQQQGAGRALQFIGTRTLDIYLLHFILLPRLPQVGVWLNANRPNFCVDVVLAVVVALVVIGFCLLVSQLLRVSPFFKLYLFGRK